MDAIAVGMAIGLFIAAGTALLGTGRSGDALSGLIDAGGQGPAVEGATGSPYDPWLMSGRSDVDPVVLPTAVVAPIVAPADVDPFWALTRHDQSAPSLTSTHVAHDH